MEDDNDNEHRALLGWILGIAVTLSITIALTSGVVATRGAGGSGSAATMRVPPILARDPAPATAPAAEAAAAAPASAPTASAAPAAPASPAVARLFFASGAAALPGDATASLAPIVEAARARTDARLAVSGFHDRTGNPEQNAELAKQRATAVRDALVAAGIPAERIELRKPVETEGGGDDRQARRVEVTIE
jgi:outer membrane protein OmpA-like peptidoglycan-associated protein